MLSRLVARWPILLAIVFSAYSVVLLWNAFQSQAQLRAAADARLIADSKRRAAALGDVAAQRQRAADELAAAHALKTYLVNKALGMSQRYGLDISLAALDQHFRAWIEGHAGAGGSGLERITYLDADGTPLADSGGIAPPPRPVPTSANRTTLTLELAQRKIVTATPVVFKGEPSGTVITLGDIAQLYRSLIHLGAQGLYRETLLSSDGREIAAPVGGLVFPAALAVALSRLPDDRLVDLAELPDAAAGREWRGSLAIRTPVPGLPVVLVTTLTRGEAYGQLGSAVVLYGLAVIPLLVLLTALRVDRLQRRSQALALEAARSDAQRQVLQGRNAELSDEIQRRQAVEAELQRHREQLEDLVSRRTSELNSLFLALPDLYYRVDSQGTILDFRPGRGATPGAPAAQVVGQRMQQVLPQAVAQQIDAALDALARGADHRAFEYGQPAAGGEQFFEARMTPLGPDQRVLVVRNVTDRRQLEIQREAHRREAERLAQVRSAFLANMSHEIRTPLSAVLGLAQIGARDARGASGEQFRRIQQAGRHLLGIIDDILDFSKLEAGKLSVEQRPFRLRATVDAAVGLVLQRAAAKGLALPVTLAPGLPDWVAGDALRLRQVLVNLLSNAVKFTEHGQVTLQVDGGPGCIEFRVADTGIGMAPDVLARLFQPFEQADGSTTRRFGGTGLGLAISRDLARLMGGELSAHSRPGEGSLFTLSLPLPAADAVDSGFAPLSEPGQRLSGLRLLAAEDVEVNRYVLRELLETEGASVTFAENGREAVDLLAQAGPTAFDAVLMDVQMPVMDGIEAMRHMRALAPALPVIGLTAHAMPEERARCLAAGMVEHVAKPIDLDTLVAAVQRHATAMQAEVALPSPADARLSDSAGPAGPIDWDGLRERFGGRRGFVSRLLATLLRNMSDVPRRLHEARAAGDLGRLAATAHEVRGVVGYLATEPLQALAARTQQAAAAGEPDAAALADALASALDELLDAVQERLGGSAQD
jgi:signal transduction histidine kinase/DNA-binding response OmpR family regulator